MTRRNGIFAAGFLGTILLAPLWRSLMEGAALGMPWARHTPMPSLPVLATMYLALGVRGSPSAGAATAGALGYVTDLVSGAPRGTYMLALLIVYFLIRAFSSRLYVQGRLAQIAVSFAATLLTGIVVVAVHVALPPRGSWSTIGMAPIEAGVTAVTAPLVFSLLWRLDRRLARGVVAEGVFR
ncbi:MAG: rod shape-determining protein MreD [Polyangia bacterium]|jgi:rod shape-determining protein MreD|nr:rod shape-determining protein MreD [Polyangia bacterium]